MVSNGVNVRLTREYWSHDVRVNEKYDHTDAKLEVFERSVSVCAYSIVNAPEE